MGSDTYCEENEYSYRVPVTGILCLELILFPIHLCTVSFGLYSIFTKTEANWKLKYTFIGYMIFSMIYMTINFIYFIPGWAFNWSHSESYCHMYIFIAQECATGFFCSFALFWLQRLVVTFESTSYKISVYYEYVFLMVSILASTAATVVNILMTINARCAYPVETLDSNPYGRAIYTCAGWPLSYETTLGGLALIGPIGQSSVLSYSYVWRLRKIFKGVKESATSRQKGETKKRIMRSSLIAVTSVLTTVVAYVALLSLQRNGFYFAHLDCTVSAILLICVFQFGDSWYRTLCGPCLRGAGLGKYIEISKTEISATPAADSGAVEKSHVTETKSGPVSVPTRHATTESGGHIDVHDIELTGDKGMTEFDKEL